MAAAKIADFTAGGTPLDADRLGGSRSPYATDPDDIYLTPANIKVYVNSNPTLAAGSTSLAAFTATAGAVKTTAGAGDLEFDGSVFYMNALASTRQVLAAQQFSVNTGAVTWTFPGNGTLLTWLASTADVLTVAAATRYFWESQLEVSFASTADTHTTSFGFLGTATFTDISYQSSTISINAQGLAAPQQKQHIVATASQIAATSTATTTVIRCSGTMAINGAGTIIPSIAMSITPNQVTTISIGAFFRIWAVGTNTVGSIGNWA